MGKLINSDNLKIFINNKKFPWGEGKIIYLNKYDVIYLNNIYDNSYDNIDGNMRYTKYMFFDINLDKYNNNELININIIRTKKGYIRIIEDKYKKSNNSFIIDAIISHDERGGYGRYQYVAYNSSIKIIYGNMYIINKYCRKYEGKGIDEMIYLVYIENNTLIYDEIEKKYYHYIDENKIEIEEEDIEKYLNNINLNIDLNNRKEIIGNMGKYGMYLYFLDNIDDNNRSVLAYIDRIYNKDIYMIGEYILIGEDIFDKIYINNSKKYDISDIYINNKLYKFMNIGGNKKIYYRMDKNRYMGIYGYNRIYVEGIYNLNNNDDIVNIKDYREE